MLGVVLLVVPPACQRDRIKGQDLAMRYCDEVSGARIGVDGYLGAARNAANLAIKAQGEPGPGAARSRTELCASLARSLLSANAYVGGFRRGQAALSHATGVDVVLVKASGVLATVVDVTAECERGDPAKLLSLLAADEAEVHGGFDQQLTLCRARGWHPVEERLGAGQR